MAKYRNNLPQLAGNFFMADGGIETTLIFHEGQDLPHFAAFILLKSEEGKLTLKKYFQTYAQLANKLSVGSILETATWRSSSDWGSKLGYSSSDLAEVNSKAVRLLEEVRSEYETAQSPLVISGCIGPRGDGYTPNTSMTEKEAEDYHYAQVETFANTAADMVSAITMNYIEEAIGITRAAKRLDIPVVISFTVETDGNLPTGQSLQDAVAQLDAATSSYPAYLMINCAHPSHFDHVLRADESWTTRIRGVRANASKMSHAELNDATEIDIGKPDELGQAYAMLRQAYLKHLNVMGGCCGTDHRHIEAIASACLPFFR